MPHEKIVNHPGQCVLVIHTISTGLKPSSANYHDRSFNTETLLLWTVIIVQHFPFN